jgi:hypothetical protein
MNYNIKLHFNLNSTPSDHVPSVHILLLFFQFNLSFPKCFRILRPVCCMCFSSHPCLQQAVSRMSPKYLVSSMNYEVLHDVIFSILLLLLLCKVRMFPLALCFQLPSFYILPLDSDQVSHSHKQVQTYALIYSRFTFKQIAAQEICSLIFLYWNRVTVVRGRELIRITRVCISEDSSPRS